MDAKRREQLESQLSAYLDDELTPEERAEVDAFLADDAEALVLLAELQATVGAVRSLPRARASDDLLDGLRERLERRALLGADRPADLTPEAVAPFRGRWLAAAAVIALTFAAGYFMWSLTGDEPTGQPTGPRYVHREAETEKRSASESFMGERDIDAGEVAKETHEISEGKGTDRIAGVPATPRAPAALEPTQWDAIESAPALTLAEAGREIKEIEFEVGLGGDVEAGFLPRAAKKPPTIDEPAGRAEAAVPLAAGGRDRGGEVRYWDAEVRSTDAFAISKGVGAAAPSHLGTSGEDVTVLELAFADAASQRRAVEALRARLAFRGPDDDRVGRGRYSSHLSSPSRLPAEAARRRIVLEKTAPASQRTHLVEGDDPVAAEDAGWFRSSDDAAAVTVLTLDVADQRRLRTIVATLQADPNTRDFRILAGPELDEVAQPTLDHSLRRAEEHYRPEKGQPDDLDRQEDLGVPVAGVTPPQATQPATLDSLERRLAEDEKAKKADETRRRSNILLFYVRVRPPATQPTTSSTAPAAETRPADHTGG